MRPVVNVPFDSGYGAELVKLPLKVEDEETPELSGIEMPEPVGPVVSVPFDSG